MSETIQSISNGTYTIGDTNKLTFSAGPGIKIDEPSEGTVRIGNDETVLWSNNNPVQITTANPLTAILTENMNNFEYLRLLFTYSYGPGTLSGMELPNSPTYALLPVISGMVCSVKLDKGEYQMLGGGFMFNDLNACYGSGTNFYVVGDGRIQMDLSGNRTNKRTDRGITPLQIVGINRISGSNA